MVKKKAIANVHSALTLDFRQAYQLHMHMPLVYNSMKLRIAYGLVWSYCDLMDFTEINTSFKHTRLFKLDYTKHNTHPVGTQFKVDSQQPVGRPVS